MRNRAVEEAARRAAREREHSAGRKRIACDGGGAAQGSAALSRLLRSAGFSAAPQILYLACSPLHGSLHTTAAAWILALLLGGLTQAALFVAVQETLGLGAARTIVAPTVAGLPSAAAGLALADVLPEALWKPLGLWGPHDRAQPVRLSVPSDRV